MWETISGNTFYADSMCANPGKQQLVTKVAKVTNVTKVNDESDERDESGETEQYPNFQRPPQRGTHPHLGEPDMCTRTLQIDLAIAHVHVGIQLPRETMSVGELCQLWK